HKKRTPHKLRLCAGSAFCFRLTGSARRPTAVRSFSICSLGGQPNQDLSPAPPRTDATAGVIASNDVAHVWKRFHPPWAGGSFFARRETSVDQSIACRSGFAPIFFRSSAVTSAGPWAHGESAGSSTSIGGPALQRAC